MQENVFKILCLDGGGIKGVFAAQVLSIFEKHFKKSSVDCFHLICGTSTGGILAAGLAAGYNAQQMVDFYLEKGPKIFDYNKRNIFNSLRVGKQLFISTKYNNKVLQRELIALFGDKKFKDSKCKLLLPTFDLSTGKTYVFKTDHDHTLSRDSEVPLWEAVMATTAAPTYFPVYKFETNKGHKFVDGGIWANNPCLLGLVEALRFFVGNGRPYDNYQLISISGLSESIGTMKEKTSIADWKTKLIEIFMASQTSGTQFITKFIASKTGGEYVRIDPMLSAEQISKFDLDNTEVDVLLNIKAIADTMGRELSQNQTIKSIYT